eukprot:3357406-Amphidinium_carterae.1
MSRSMSRVSAILEGIALLQCMLKVGQAADEQIEGYHPLPTASAPRPRRAAGVPLGVIRRPPYTPFHIKEEFEEKNTRRTATQGVKAATPPPACRQAQSEMTTQQA